MVPLLQCGWKRSKSLNIYNIVILGYQEDKVPGEGYGYSYDCLSYSSDTKHLIDSLYGYENFPEMITNELHVQGGQIYQQIANWNEHIRNNKSLK